MVTVRWEIDGKPVDPRDAADALTMAIRKQVEEQIKSKIGGCVCPEHGQRPVIVGGDPLLSSNFRVEGCCQVLIDEVTRKLT